MRPALLVPAALAALLAGCAPALQVVTLEPAEVNLGRVRQLSLLQLEGDPEARRALADALARMVEDTSPLTVRDRTQEGLVVRVAGRGVDVLGGPAQPLAPGEAGVLLAAGAIETEQTTRVETRKDDKGNEVKEEKVEYSARVAFTATVFTPDRRAYVAEQRFEGRGDGDDADTARAEALRRATFRLSSTICPRYRFARLRLDTRDPDQRPLLDWARKQSVADALPPLQDYLAAHPDRTAAVYNVAVLLDALGRYDEALAGYERALAAPDARGFYSTSRAACARRRADALALAR